MSYFDRLEALKNSIVEKNNSLQAYANEASQNAEDTLKAKVQDVSEKLEAIGGTGFAAIKAGKSVKGLYDKWKKKREGKSEEDTNEEPNTEEQDNTGQGESTPTSEEAQATTENPQSAMEGEGEVAQPEQVHIDSSNPFEGALDRDVQVGGEWEPDENDLTETLEKPVEVDLNDPAQVQQPESTNPAKPDAEPESVPDEAPAMGEEVEAEGSGETLGEEAASYNPVAPGTSVEMEDASNFGARQGTATLRQGELGETTTQQSIADADPESVEATMGGLSTDAGEGASLATTGGEGALDALSGGAGALAGDGAASGLMAGLGIADGVLDAIPVIGEVALVATAIAGFFESLFGGGSAPDQQVEAKSGFDVNSLVKQTATSLQV